MKLFRIIARPKTECVLHGAIKWLSRSRASNTIKDRSLKSTFSYSPQLSSHRRSHPVSLVCSMESHERRSGRLWYLSHEHFVSWLPWIYQHFLQEDQTFRRSCFVAHPACLHPTHTKQEIYEKSLQQLSPHYYYIACRLLYSQTMHKPDMPVFYSKWSIRYSRPESKNWMLTM